MKALEESRAMSASAAALFLLERYHRCSVRDPFVTVLIGELLVLRARQGCESVIRGADVQRDRPVVGPDEATRSTVDTYADAASADSIPARYKPATWRDTTEVDPFTGTFGLGFERSDGDVFLRLDMENGRHLAETIHSMISHDADRSHEEAKSRADDDHLGPPEANRNVVRRLKALLEGAVFCAGGGAFAIGALTRSPIAASWLLIVVACLLLWIGCSKFFEASR